MTRTHWARLALMSLALAGALAVASARDVVVTQSGMRVEGTILSETESELQIRTSNYGDLTFRKVNLREIQRANAPVRPSTGTHSPFAPSENPFSASRNPFAAPEGSTSPSGTARRPAQSFGTRPTVTPPSVPLQWDAVFFDLPEGATARIRSSNLGVTPIVATNSVNLVNGAVVETQSAPARLVFKNGRDMARLAPRSIVVVVSSTSDAAVLELRQGSLWIDAVSPHRVTVRTINTEVVGAGTVFRVADALDMGYHVACTEGSVTVRSLRAQMSMTLGTNQMLIVRPDGGMTEATEVSDSVRQEDVQFAGLDDDWWLRRERTGLPPEVLMGATPPPASIGDLNARLAIIADAFFRFAQDTGHIPTLDEGFSPLRANTGDWSGWSGPYVEGIMPPLDMWGRPMRYAIRRTGNERGSVGIVYSAGEDNIDHGGDPSADITHLVLYYQVDRLAGSPTGP